MASKFFDDVMQYNVNMECIPTFEELRDIEMCRVVGAQNMFNTNAVMRWLFDRNLYAGIQWLERCRELNVLAYKSYSDGVKLHERTHGPKSTWFTKKDLKALEIIAAKNHLNRAQLELNSIENDEE